MAKVKVVNRDGAAATFTTPLSREQFEEHFLDAVRECKLPLRALREHINVLQPNMSLAINRSGPTYDATRMRMLEWWYGIRVRLVTTRTKDLRGESTEERFEVWKE